MWPCEVAQSCLTLYDPMDCNLPGSSVHGILQARVLERVPISFSRGSSWPRNRTWVSHIARQTLYLLSCQGSTFTALILLNSSLRHNQCCYLVIFKEIGIKWLTYINLCVLLKHMCKDKLTYSSITLPDFTYQSAQLTIVKWLLILN